MQKIFPISIKLLEVIEGLVEKVAHRMKRKHVLAQTISITIRYKDRKTITRSKKLTNPVMRREEIGEAAKRLFLKNWNGEPVRLLGVTGTDLIEQEDAVKQLDLFSYEKEANKEPLFQTMERLREKYGKNIIEKAGDLTENQMKMPLIGADTSFNKDFLIHESSIK